MNKRSAPLLAAAVAAVLPGALAALPAHAQGFASQDLIAQGQERFIVDLGGIVNRFDSTVRVNGQGTRGTDINLENNDLGRNLSTFEGALTWRFLPNHRLDARYFQANRSGSRTYQGEIDIGDQAFPVGATVAVDAKSQFFDVDYRWSFWHTREFEAALVLGLYGGTFKYDIDAVGTAGGGERSYHKSVSTTVPLPVIGASIDWYPDPRWTVSAQFAGMKANIGDIDGHAYVAGVNAEFQLMRGLGLGLRYGYTDINADVDKSDFKGNLGAKTNSVSVYAKFVF